jgi:signal transduction histidine kinase
LDVIREAGRWIRQKLASIEHKLKVSELNLAEPIMEQCDLSELVEDVIFEYRDWANGRGINLVCASFNVIPYAEGDPRYLHAILVDLVSNAINSCQAGDEVALSYGCEDDKIFVDVRDTGKGMNWQERRQVETDLQAYHYQDTQIGRGLYYAGRFARLHLGRVISMGSELGQGSWFRLVLPQPASESFAFELIGACASG